MQLPYIVSTDGSVMFPVPPRVKVCCIASEEEAALAVRMGASALGLVSRMPSGPGPIPESRIRDIAETVPPGVATFLLTCETTAEPLITQQRFCRTTTLQLVDEVEPGVHARLRDALPGISIVQVIHVRRSCLGPSASFDASREVIFVRGDTSSPRAARKSALSMSGMG